MTLMKTLSAGAAAIALTTAFVIAVPTPAMAQQTTSEIRGAVTTDDGSAAAGATVTIVDTRTNATRTVTTNSDGAFSARGLTVGGPYTVSTSLDGFQTQRLQGVRAGLGSSTNIAVSLNTSVTGDEIIVVATRSNVAELAIGPNTTFDLESLESFPSISRDIRDIIRIDPRVSLDLNNDVQRVSCLGGNDRSNTFTVDGVIQADVFGLNGTPFASRNAMVVPFDSIAQTSVEFAPFDVEYGQFTGCNINVVTKSGSNEVHGSAFFNYAGSGLQGKSIEGNDFEVAAFDDFNWGATIGGPVIKDKLFFFAAYEETDDADSQENGPIGAGFANEGTRGEPDLASVQAVQQVLEDVYGIQTGGIARALPQSSRRILTRWDWLINDSHRLEFTYQRLRETNIEADSFGFDPNGFTFFNSFEDEGTKSETYSARFFSQWTDNFSTEIRASRADVLDIQGPVGGGEAQSANPLPEIVVGTGGDTTVSIGPGRFRSANELDSQVDQIKIKANYQANNHLLTAGYELNQLDIFNLFIDRATGTLIFQDLAALQAGTISAGTNTFADRGDVNSGSAIGAFGNFSLTGNPRAAAAVFSRSIHSLYLQDEWEVNSDLNVLFGLRYEFFKGNDAPLENPNFVARYGFSNARDFTDLDIILPRFGFTYDVPDDVLFMSNIQFRGGTGKFTGGDPTVWFSNAFSNSGNLVGFGTSAAAGCTPADLQVLNGGTFTGVPQCVIDAGAAQAQQSRGDTRSTDPNLALPSVFRTNIGFTTFTNFTDGDGFFDGWRLDVDYIHSQFLNPLTFVDLSQTIDPSRGLNGFTLDGRPIYRAIDPTATNCNAQLVGTGGNNPQYTGVTSDCFSTSRDDEIQLTNSMGFSTQVVSALLGKKFEYNAFGREGSARINMGYSWTDANNRRDATSSRSVSNFDGTALFDRQNPGVGTSGFETRHNFTFALNLRQEFVEDYATRLGLFFSAQRGRPYSFTFDGRGDFNDSSSGSDNALLYVPTGVNDPNLSPFSDAAAVAALDAFIADEPCLVGDRGFTATRNGCRMDWFLDLDLRFQQELPVPGNFGNDRLLFYVDFDNFANLISDKANLRRQVSANVDLVDVSVDSAGRYIITDFNPDFRERVSVGASVWTVQFGIRYEF